MKDRIHPLYLVIDEKMILKHLKGMGSEDVDWIQLDSTGSG